MKDMHNHLLYGIDDGPANIDESVNIIKDLADLGYTDLILTPHYIEETKFNADNGEKNKRLIILKKALAKEKVKINLHLGNEVFISENIDELLKFNKISSLAKSKYLLIEYSLYNQLSNDKDILLDLIDKGYIPILAHIERYRYYNDNINYYKELVNKGVLLQGNLLSLQGSKKKKKFLNILLKENLIHFLATDIHKKEDVKLLNKSLIKLNKIIDKDKQKELLDDNIYKVINNLDV